MRTEAQLTVSHWTSVQLDPETKNPQSPQWNSAGECCVKLRVLTRKPADQIAVRNCIKHSLRERHDHALSPRDPRSAESRYITAFALKVRLHIELNRSRRRAQKQTTE